MTRQQIEKHIEELNKLEWVRPYPIRGEDAQHEWREHHDRFIGDIKRLEFLLARLPRVPGKTKVEPLRL